MESKRGLHRHWVQRNREAYSFADQTPRPRQLVHFVQYGFDYSHLVPRSKSKHSNFVTPCLLVEIRLPVFPQNSIWDQEHQDDEQLAVCYLWTWPNSNRQASGYRPAHAQVTNLSCLHGCLLRGHGTIERECSLRNVCAIQGQLCEADGAEGYIWCKN